MYPDLTYLEIRISNSEEGFGILMFISELDPTSFQNMYPDDLFGNAGPDPTRRPGSAAPVASMIFAFRQCIRHPFIHDLLIYIFIYNCTKCPIILYNGMKLDTKLA